MGNEDDDYTVTYSDHDAAARFFGKVLLVAAGAIAGCYFLVESALGSIILTARFPFAERDIRYTLVRGFPTIEQCKDVGWQFARLWNPRIMKITCMVDDGRGTDWRPEFDYLLQPDYDRPLDASSGWNPAWHSDPAPGPYGLTLYQGSAEAAIEGFHTMALCTKVGAAFQAMWEPVIFQFRCQAAGEG